MIEQILDDVVRHLQATLKIELDRVMGESVGGGQYPLVAPRNESYFIHEPDEFKAYIVPAVFVMPASTTRPGEGLGDEYNQLIYQEHGVTLLALIEEIDAERMQRVSLRYAKALDNCLHDQEMSTEPTRSTKAFVTGIDYGVMWNSINSDQRTFRKDISVEMLVKHWDRFIMAPQS